ncbi:MAG: phage integrase SAM-like domain-containing protein [Streptosporangiaceae bacterium]
MRPKTVRIYASLLKLHIAPHFAEVTIAEVTLARVRRWRKELLDLGVSEITAAEAYRLLRAIFNTALDDGLIKRNPGHSFGPPKSRASRHDLPALIP